MNLLQDVTRIPEPDVWVLGHYLIFRIATAEIPRDENGLFRSEAEDQVTVLAAAVVNAWNQTHSFQIDMPWLWEIVKEMRERDAVDYHRIGMVRP